MRAGPPRPLSWDTVDHLLALDLGARGIGAIFTPGAARAAARALRRARRVLIVTGFTVAEGMPETDGPPGAAVLGRALRLAGTDVVHVVDRVNVPIVEAALAALDERGVVERYPEGRDAAARVLMRHRPTHLVAIERPGRGQDGDYLTARGESVARWNAPLDDLFLARSRATTIGVGDGGNEIGMGNVRPSLLRQSALMARIASVVMVDHLVVAGTSNWGAYGIAAELSCLVGRPLLHGADGERRVIRACVEAGAYDGIARHREPTVDGLPLELHAAIVEMLGRAAAARAGRRAPAASGMMSRARATARRRKRP